MTAPSSEFDAVWTIADAVSGWLSRDQGRALWDAVASTPAGGRILEIGSHQGRSTVVLAAAAARQDSEVIAVDPFLAGGMFGGATTRERFEQNLCDSGVRDVVRLITVRSTELRLRWQDPLSMLYIDGKHDYWTARDDLRWTCHLPPGAPVLIHDSFSSIGVTLALLAHVLPRRSPRYVGRVGSLAHFEVGRGRPRDRLRMAGQLPWFARNVAIKVVLRLARVLGYHGTDPY